MTCFLISLQAPRGRLGSVRDCSTAACCDAAPFSIWFGSLHLIKAFWIKILKIFKLKFRDETYDNRLHFSSLRNKTSQLSVIWLEISWASNRACFTPIAKHTCIGWEFVELMNWTARIQCWKFQFSSDRIRLTYFYCQRIWLVEFFCYLVPIAFSRDWYTWF